MVLFLIADDEETIAQLMDTGFESIELYGEVLKIGEGKEPTKDEFHAATEKCIKRQTDIHT